MLTVFQANMNALSFYNKRGYVIDKSSPSNHSSRDGDGIDCDYEILSKVL